MVLTTEHMNERWHDMAHVTVGRRPRASSPVSHSVTRTPVRSNGRAHGRRRTSFRRPGCRRPSLEMTVSSDLTKLDPTLRRLAVEAAAGTIGCSWCADYGYYEGMNEGIDPAKVRAADPVARQRPLRRPRAAVLEYAEKPSGSPVTRSPTSSLPGCVGSSAPPRSSSWRRGSRWRSCGRGSTPAWACTARASPIPVRSPRREDQDGEVPGNAAIA